MATVDEQMSTGGKLGLWKQGQDLFVRFSIYIDERAKCGLRDLLEEDIYIFMGHADLAVSEQS